MLKDMDFGVYGKGIDGYIHHSLAMDRIQEEEENRKALMDEFDSFALNKCHKAPPVVFLIAIIVIVVVLVNSHSRGD